MFLTYPLLRALMCDMPALVHRAQSTHAEALISGDGIKVLRASETLLAGNYKTCFSSVNSWCSLPRNAP